MASELSPASSGQKPAKAHPAVPPLRSLLAGALGALALPAAVMAASTPAITGAAAELDAELFGLIAAAREAAARFEAASVALEEAEHRTEEVPASRR